MVAPDRPVAGNVVETDWGQQVHDRIFAPKGCHVHGSPRALSAAGGSTPVASFVTFYLELADDDPGGWLDASNHRLVVPADADGKYLISVSIDDVDNDAGNAIRAFVRLNSTYIAGVTVDGQGSAHARGTIATLTDLTAGDVLQVKGGKIGSGDGPTVAVSELQVLRVGAEYGA